MRSRVASSSASAGQSSSMALPCCGRKRRWSAVMAYSVMAFLLREFVQTGLEQRLRLGVAEAQLAHRPRRRLQRRPQHRGLVMPGRFAAAAGHRHADAAQPLQQALGLQHAVGLADGHGVDRVVHGDGAHGRQVVARLELAAGDHAAHLLDDLAVDRRRCGGGDVEYHVNYCITTTIHLQAVDAPCLSFSCNDRVMFSSAPGLYTGFHRQQACCDTTTKGNHIMLNFKRASALLLTIGVSALFAGVAQAAAPSGTSADFGSAASAIAAERQIDLSAATKSINVNDGETVCFTANGKSFTWHFDTYANQGAFDLSKIAPADVMVNGVHVYVASNPVYRG